MVAFAADTSAICSVPSFGFPCWEKFLFRGLVITMGAEALGSVFPPRVVGLVATLLN
jgi:hypothetical protein